MTDIDPDPREQDFLQPLDDAIPSVGYTLQPVVGIGGSAGAIEALQVLLASVPSASGLAYVVILHLSRDHESTLAALLQRSTSMRVIQVQHDQPIEPDTVYVIPPRYALRTMDGQIQLADLPQERHRHVAVDLFFRALADTHGPHAVAVVLSGADGDGASGIKRIKERGGLTIAQDPQEAGNGGMPRSAIATGMVDWMLPAAEMGQRIVDYVRREQTVRLPPEHEPPAGDSARAPVDESGLRDVLNLLKARTGRDFSNYKRATILRRIGRRMQVNAVEDMGTYLACLRTRPGEAAALLQDLLITVTNFFRDAECFAALEEHIPELFKGKGPADTVRVWVAACATGEEAYSIAMILSEYARALEAPPAIQVFASDLDDEAIRVAREAIYPPTIEGDVSEERLRRFFVREHRGYRVRRELREMVLFAAHDLLKDSPFSRLDLVSCRNLLIYLNREAQERMLDTFHFALHSDALLFLGSSESVGDASSLFAAVDKRRRLFRKRPARRVTLPGVQGPGSLALALEPQRDDAYSPVVSAGSAFGRTAALQRRPPGDADGGRSASWGELHFRLIDHLAPPSILVDEQQDILHLSAAAGRLLLHGGGEPSRNLMRVIHPALRIELRAALYRAAQSGEVADGAPVVLDIEGERKTIAVRVQPVGEIASGLQLVILRNVDDAQAMPSPERLQGETGDAVAEHLDHELERLKSHLRDTVEQYEASTEELKASNEELQAMNEELRSASEELETSREELQSINEELTTVNHELKSNVDELAHANSDMHNLMDATAIATIFLDRDLRITRYTPSARTLFKLIPTDVGRPLSDLTTELDYPALGEDARRVLDRLIPVETEVGRAGDGWFLVRVLPYRTLDDHIAGVVLTFVDISELKQAQEALQASEDRFGAIVNEAAVGVVQADPRGLITYTNRFYAQMLGYEEGELRGRNLLDLVHPDDREISRWHMAELVRHRRPFQFEKRCVCKRGAVIWLHNSVSLLAGSQSVAMLIVSTDISERKHAEAALRSSEERMRLVLEAAVEYAIFTTDPAGRITTWNPGAQRLLGYSESEVIGQKSDLIFIEADRRAGAPAAEIEQAVRDGRAADDRLHQRKDGSQFWASGALMPMLGAGDTILGFVKILRDQSAQRAAQDALEASNRSKDRFLAVLSHELRNPLASVHGAALALAGERLAEDERRRAIEIVQRQADHMRVLLDELLDISTLRLGRMTLRLESVRVRELVEAALEATRHALEAAGHALAVHLPTPDIMLVCDRVRMSQVLANLLANAIKYTPDGGHIEVSARLLGEREVQFTISDDGDGMEASTVESMFEMFSRNARAQAGNKGGLGIGLALVRSIVDLHGGRVVGESDGPGKGARFTVTVPVRDDQPPVELDAPPSAPPDGDAKASRAPRGQDARRGRRVVIVDDNVDAAWPVARMLELAGYSVRVAHSGEEALALVSEEPVDVVILDIGLPGLSGYEVANRLRARPGAEALVLVAATGWGQPDDLTKAKEAGFDMHFVKPLDVRTLVAELSQRLG